MAKKTCTISTIVEGDDIIIRFVNGRVADAQPPRLNASGQPNKKGMVQHTGGFQMIDEVNAVSAMLMRKA